MRAAPPAARNDDLNVPRRMRTNAPPTNEVATLSTQATGSGQWISQVMARSARRSAKDLWDMTQSYTGMTIAYMTRMTFKNVTIALLSALAIPACVAADQTEADVLDDDISEPIEAVGAADASTCVLDERMEKRARGFALNRGLIDKNDEIATDWYALRWSAHHVRFVEKHNVCLVVLNQTIETKDENNEWVTSKGDQWRVFAMNPRTQRFRLFAQALRVPQVLYAGIGKREAQPAPLYYTELRGKSAHDAYAVALAGVPADGLLAELSAKNLRFDENNKAYGEPDGKEPFDPTPNRTWKIKNATFDMNRGVTTEVLDVPAKFVDDDFVDAIGLCSGPIGPWSADMIRWREPSNPVWTNVIYND